MGRLQGLSFVFLSGLLLVSCQNTAEQIDKGAENTGKVVGKVLDVPTKVMEGASNSDNKPQDNPYNRE